MKSILKKGVADPSGKPLSILFNDLGWLRAASPLIYFQELKPSFGYASARLLTTCSQNGRPFKSLQTVSANGFQPYPRTDEKHLKNNQGNRKR